MKARHLAFAVAGEEYGVAVERVREILNYEHVRRVPRAMGLVRGVIELRGRVAPVLDLAVRFGLPAAPVTRRSCVVIVEADVLGEPVLVGFMSDGVNDVVEFSAEDVEAAPSSGTWIDVAYLKGMGRAGDRFVLLLDPARVLSAELGALVRFFGQDSTAARAMKRATAIGRLSAAF